MPKNLKLILPSCVGILIGFKRKQTMQMSLAKQDGKPYVYIEHNGDTVVWNVNIFDASNFKGHFDQAYDIFKHNNDFWAAMKPETQAAIFVTYKKLRDSLENYTERTSLTIELFPLIKELFDYHRLDDIENWILYRTNVQFPHDLQHEYIVSNERTGTREQTYLRDDYIKLICLTFTLRLMIPIWGEFISRTKREIGTQFKEYYGFQLLSQSHIYTSPAMEKLKLYVFKSIPDERSKGSVLGGLSSEDFPIWILSLVIIRKLCTSDISGTEPNPSLIPYIYNHVRERVSRSDNNFVGIVREKVSEKGGNNDAERLSKLEGYKIKQETAPGDIVLLECVMRDIVGMTKRICPDIDLNLLESALRTSKELETKRIHNAQITLIQWVFKPVISPRAIMLLSKTAVINAAAATQAILFHKQHLVLAGIVTACAYDNVDEMYIGGVDSRARITKDLIEDINKYYPYTRRSTSKAKTAKNSNQVIVAIDEMCEMLAQHNWKLTIDSDYLPYVSGKNNRHLSIPHDIKIQLAKLIIELAKSPREITTTI